MRRAKNEGSIRQRSDGRWEARATGGIDYRTGKPKRISVQATPHNCKAVKNMV